MMPLLLSTLAAYKTYAGIDAADTSQDDQITKLIEACSQRIETYCRRDFEKKDYQDEFPGYGSDVLQLYNYPVVPDSVTVEDDNSNPVTDFKLRPETGELRRKAKWGRCREYTVTYQAGYDTAPADLQLACNIFIAYHLQLPEHIGIDNEQIGPLRNQYSVPGEMPAEVLPYVEAYKREPML